MTPFQRLVLFAGAATVAGSIAAVAVFVSAWVGLAALAGGIVIVAVSTVELQPPGPGPDDGWAPEPVTAIGRDGSDAPLRIRDRKAIVEDAERSREPDRGA